MPLRLRLILIAGASTLAVVGMHLIGARPAVAATAKPKHHIRAHHVPVREPLARPRPAHAHSPATRQKTTSGRAHPGGLTLAVRRPGHEAHAAGDPGASIVDFSFSPSTITIHVGDTITWTNVGKAPHTATADNHSFNTGVLKTGQSASHTFTAPGTYGYFCIVHPFMKGTVIVLANTTTTTSTTPTTTTPTTTTPTATTAASGGLPNTGLDILGVVACGAGMCGFGLALRRRLSQ